MSNHGRFRHRSVDDLKEAIASLGLQIPFATDLSALADPVSCGPVTSPNRFAVHPMEGFDSDEQGCPTGLSFRRYRRYAEGGFGLLWFEATTVLREARSNPGQLWLHGGSVAAFADLVSATRRAARDARGHDPVCILQLTHSGRYSKPTGVPEPIIAHHSPVLDPKHGLAPDYPLVTDDYLDRLQDTFVEAAKLARAAGFDGVDVKACHRYLVAELHASLTRDGKYGGALENRTRFLRETLARIRDEVPDLIITTRLNAYDAIRYPYGFGVDREAFARPDLTEPLELVGQLRRIGIPLLNLSIGNPYYNPHYGRPYDFAIAGFNCPEEHPLEGIARFLDITATVQKAFPDLPVVGSGYTWLRQFMPHVAAGVIAEGGATLIGQGRGAFAYPDSVRDILDNGAMDPAKCCVTCSGCTQIMRDGGKTGCVVRDKEIYGHQYRLSRRFAVDRLQEEARRCRECLEPTCVGGCPAAIDIPAFVRAFADGDFARSYDVLRDRNVLPEMCGCVCPAAEQCQGGCVETVFCDNPVPIRDIQLVVSRIARRMGLTGVRLPEAESGRCAAVVGAGPAGLACAVRLLEKGHSVALFDKTGRLGGTPDATIPAERYSTARVEVDAILAPAIDAGRLEIRTGVALGKDVSVQALRLEFDAVFLAVGLTSSQTLGQVSGVWDALAFLRAAKDGDLEELPDSVAVLGAGNTAMDAAATAARLGARDVYIVYRRSFAEMPAWEVEREAAAAAGVHILILSQPLGYETDADGALDGVRVARTRLGEPDDSGRRRPEVIPGSEFVLPAQLAVEAMGQRLADEAKAALGAVGLTDWGTIQVDANDLSTTCPGIYAGGDAVNGGTTAVRGIAEGMLAAESMDRQLAQERCASGQPTV